MAMDLRVLLSPKGLTEMVGKATKRDLRVEEGLAGCSSWSPPSSSIGAESLAIGCRVNGRRSRSRATARRARH